MKSIKNTQKMTKESEAKLLRCLDDVAADNDHFDDPNTVIAKYASQHKIPHGHIHLLVTAYNTGRTTKQREEAETVWDKSASFPVANTSEIIAKIYPDKLSTKSASFTSDEVSPDYSKTVYEIFSEAKTKERLSNSSSINWKMTDKVAEVIPNYSDKEYTKKYSDWHRAKKAAEETRSYAAFAADTMMEHITEIVDYFKSANHIPFCEVRNNCELKYGTKAANLFSYLSKRSPFLTKQASGEQLGPIKGEIYDTIKRALDTVEIYQELKNSWYEKEALAEQAATELRYTKKQDKSVIDSFDFKQAADSPGKQFGVGATSWLTKGLGQQALQPTITGVFEQKKPSPIMSSFDAKHRSILDSVDRHAAISSLLQELPQYNPADVLGAYKELQDIAPRASSKPAIMKDYIKRKIEGGPHSYFDLEVLTKIEKNLAALEGRQSSED